MREVTRRAPFRTIGGRAILAAALVALACLTRPLPAVAEDKVVVPNWWDTKRKPERIETGSIRVIRFLVDDEFPPFHYADRDGTLVGFSVDLARALCLELKVACTIQARQWDTLLDSLAEGRGDAVIAAMRMNATIKARFRVGTPYHRSPARFVARVGATAEIDPEALAGRAVAVARGSAHEAFLETFFPKAKLLPQEDAGAALAALKAGTADLAFGDGASVAIWLNGTEAAGCCAFAGGPYLEPRYFGEGVGIILRKDDRALARALDQGLAVLAHKGTYAELYLKHFPVGFY